MLVFMVTKDDLDRYGIWKSKFCSDYVFATSWCNDILVSYRCDIVFTVYLSLFYCLK